MIYLSLPETLVIARLAVGPDVRVRDVGMLASAITRPAMTAFGDDAYPSLDTKAAALLESLARNHPLVDGNKRLAWTATVVFSRLNGQDLTYATVAEAEAFVVGVAAGSLSFDQIATWICDRTVPA